MDMQSIHVNKYGEIVKKAENYDDKCLYIIKEWCLSW